VVDVVGGGTKLVVGELKVLGKPSICKYLAIPFLHVWVKSSTQPWNELKLNANSEKGTHPLVNAGLKWGV
jgi:hypothetical protein